MRLVWFALALALCGTLSSTSAQAKPPTERASDELGPAAFQSNLAQQFALRAQQGGPATGANGLFNASSRLQSLMHQGIADAYRWFWLSRAVSPSRRAWRPR